jgi:Uri superfamily endonuclease
MMAGVPITVLGDDAQSGSYLLRMRIRQPITVIFGRFDGGKAHNFSRGEALYVGSAMNGLAPRLIRHATRSGSKPPHPIRQHMLAYFPTVSLGKALRLPVAGKKLHWHVDHLLDQESVELHHTIIIRSRRRLEVSLAHFLAQEPATSILVKGLGASDAPGSTHLMAINASEVWWRQLPARITIHLRSA